MRMRISRLWAGFARGVAALCLAVLVAAPLVACGDPLPDAGETPAAGSRPANDGEEPLDSGCRAQESGAESDTVDLQRSRLLRLILLVGQIEVAFRSSERSISWEDVPIFPLSAEHRALLRTNAAEIDAIREGIEAVLNEMEGSDRARELRSRRQPLMLASIAWADWLIELVERDEEAFDEQPDGGAPIRQARELFDELLAELYSLDARSACPDSAEGAAASDRANAVILRMLMLISLMESEVRSVCAVTGCPARRVDAPLTAAERAVLRHAGSRLVILRDLVWDPQDLRLTEAPWLPRALVADLEAAPVPLDELTTQWFRFASRGARGGPDALSGAQVIYGILGAQVAVFNVYARHFGLP